MKPPTFMLLLVLAASSGVLAADRPSGSATISGTVTDERTGGPVAGLRVEIYGGIGVTPIETDEAGRFSLSGLLPGIYHLRTDSRFTNPTPSDLLDELYDDVPCPLGCNPVTGTPILLADGGTASVEIALGAGGSLSGTIVGESTGEPLANVQVQLFDTTGASIANAATGADGSYLLRRLPAGTYFARTFDRSGFLGELYDGAPCPHVRCDPIRGTPVAVRPGTETEGVDFALARGGVLSGTVVDAATGEPVSGVLVEVDDSAGDLVARAGTDAAGAYAAGGLPADRNFVRALDSAGFLGELYDGLPCVPGECDSGAGTRVAVRPGRETAGIDFALERGAAISGTVTAEDTGEALPGVTVFVEAGARVTAMDRTDGEGGYRIDGLRAGRYFVNTASSAELVDELHERIPCPRGSCDPETGTPVVVGDGEEVRVDFGLATGGSVSGRVMAEDTGEPVSGVSILVVDSDLKVASSDRSDEDGRYRATGLPSGSYVLESLHSGDFFSHVFGGGPCPVTGPCDVTGESVRVEAGTDTGNVDFSLRRGLGISGRLVGEGHGFGLPGVSVTAFDPDGMPIGSARTDELGGYRIRTLPAGTFFVRAGVAVTGIVTRTEVLDELYDDVPCPFGDCDVTAGTPFVLEAESDATGIDFDMAQGGVLSGTLTEEATGAPIRRPAWVDVFDSSGVRIASVNVDRNGNFRVGALPTGSYYLRVPSSTGLIGELYGGRPCVLDCDATAGVPVAVTAGSERSGIDFRLTLGGGFEGRISRDGVVELFFGSVDVFDAGGSFLGKVTPTQPVSIVSRDSTGYRVGGLPPGSYFVRAEAPGLVGELYGGVTCPLKCDPESGTPVPVRGNASTKDVDFQLDAGGRLSGTVTDAATGVGVADLAVVVYGAEGRRLGTVESGADGRYVVDGLPAGTYFVRVFASHGYRGRLFDGAPCPFRSCRVTAGTPVEVAVGEETGGVDFDLERTDG